MYINILDDLFVYVLSKILDLFLNWSVCEFSSFLFVCLAVNVHQSDSICGRDATV